MVRIFNLLMIVASVSLPGGILSVASHAETAPAAVEGSSGAPAGSAPTAQSAFVVDCKKPTSDLPRAADHGPVSVTVNAATAWQPRGGEVLIAIAGDSANFSGLIFKACFGWNNAKANDYISAKNLNAVAWDQGFVNIRPTEPSGTLNLGVIVPSLDWAPTNFVGRWFSTGRSSGLGLVPVADLRLIAYTKDGVLFNEVRPVGITNVPVALIVAAGALVIAVMGLHRLSIEPPQAIEPPPTKPAPSHRPRLKQVLNAIFSPDWILTLIQTPDGRASLSAFQVLLWTLVVAVSAMYVMVLSGNLVNLTSGTLTLLGIAGAAGLLAAYTDASGQSGIGATGATGPGPTGATGTGATGRPGRVRRGWPKPGRRARPEPERRARQGLDRPSPPTQPAHNGATLSLIPRTESRTSVEPKCCSSPWSVRRLSWCRC